MFKIKFNGFSLNRYLPTELAYFVAFAPIFNLFVIFSNHSNTVLYLGQILGLFYILLTPGLFTLPLLTNKKMPFALGIAYSAAISTFLLMFFGLIINTLLPMVGYDKPLTTFPLLVTFDLIIAVLFSVNAYYNKHFILELPSFKKIDYSIILACILMPLLVCMGALSLNNGGDSTFTLVGLALVFAIGLLVVLFESKVSDSIFPIVLYFFALTFLLMNAMRGWYVSGHDILLEYHVFYITKEFGIWKMAFYQDPYNACLSLTILPTYLYKLLHLNELYVYKFFIHFLGALPVVVVYYLSKQYISRNFAFLVGLLYVTFPTYIVDMAFLNRQGIAFLFFGLIIYGILNGDYFSGKKRALLLFAFGAGMIFSHYSTSYIAVPVLISTYFLNRILRFLVLWENAPDFITLFTDKIKNKEQYKKPILISFTFVFGLAFMMVFWSTFITKTSTSFLQTIEQIAISLKDPFNLDGQTGPAKYSIFKGQQLSPDESLDLFIKESIKDNKVIEKQSEFYPLSSTEKFRTYPVPEYIAPLTNIGESIYSVVKIEFNKFYIFIKQIYAKLLQVLLFIGLFGLTLGFTFKNIIEKDIPIEYIALSYSALFVMVGQTILPAVAINYGLLRLFQQNLLFLSMPILLGFCALISVLFKNISKQYYLTAFTLLAFFLILSGVIPQITGGTRPLIYLNNSGLYYDSYLVHAEEVYSSRWISQYSGARIPVQAAHFSDIKMVAYGKLAPYIELLPETTKRHSFVYLNYDNVRTENILEIVYGDVIYYKFPMQFLRNNKNLIYNNGGSHIYK